MQAESCQEADQLVTAAATGCKRDGSTTWAQAGAASTSAHLEELRELGLELHLYLKCEHPSIQSADCTVASQSSDH